MSDAKDRVGNRRIRTHEMALAEREKKRVGWGKEFSNGVANFGQLFFKNSYLFPETSPFQYRIFLLCSIF